MATLMGRPPDRNRENIGEYQTFADHGIGWASESILLFKGKGDPQRTSVYYVQWRK